MPAMWMNQPQLHAIAQTLPNTAEQEKPDPKIHAPDSIYQNSENWAKCWKVRMVVTPEGQVMTWKEVFAKVVCCLGADRRDVSALWKFSYKPS